MFDMSDVWAGVLKSLRENKEPVLLGACSDPDDIEFTRDYINLTTSSESIFLIWKKYQDILNKYAGGDYIQIFLKKKTHGHNKTTEKLREIFGDKLKVEVN